MNVYVFLRLYSTTQTFTTCAHSLLRIYVRKHYPYEHFRKPSQRILKIYDIITCPRTTTKNLNDFPRRLNPTTSDTCMAPRPCTRRSTGWPDSWGRPPPVLLGEAGSGPCSPDLALGRRRGRAARRPGWPPEGPRPRRTAVEEAAPR